MAEQRNDLTRIVETLKEPVRLDPALDKRVMAQVERLPKHSDTARGLRGMFEWLWRPQTIQVSPLAGFGVGALLIVLVLAASRLFAPSNESDPLATMAAGDFGQNVQFVFVAPEAASVSLVGDFNDWSASATPLVRQGGDGLWWVTVPLTPGRYRYSFIVDGTTWVGDPNAPAAADEFGRPNSVVTIGGA